MIAKAVAKSRDDRYARPSEFALALRQAVGARTRPWARDDPRRAAPLPLRPLRPSSRPSRRPAGAEPEPAAAPQPHSRRRPQGLRTAAKLVVGGGILAVMRRSRRPHSLLALSGGKSSSAERAAATSTAAHGWHADRRARGVEPAVRPGAVTGREGVHSAKHAGQRGSGDLSSACRRRPIRHRSPTRSDSRSIPGHRPSSAPTGRSSPRLAVPATRWSNADPPRRANVPGSTRPGSGAVGSSATRTRRGTSSSSGRTRSSGARITWTCSAPRPSPAARRRSSAAGGIRSTTRSANAVRRSARSFASTPSPGSPGPRDRLRRSRRENPPGLDSPLCPRC